jgi:Domain of unknown function (DUF1990)
VIDGGDAFGFAYGTLPVRPECGEESFFIRCRHTGEICFDIVAYSRPAHPLVRLREPVARAIQLRSSADRGLPDGVGDESSIDRAAVVRASTTAPTQDTTRSAVLTSV